MSLEKPIPGSAADWLRHARSDLAMANVALPPDVLLNEPCFHAQQAAEKSLKAMLLHYGIEFPATHDIDYLIKLLPPTIVPPLETEELAELTNFAVVFRYPSEYEDVTEEEYQWALEAANTVYRWAATLLLPDDSDQPPPKLKQRRKKKSD